MIKNVYIYLILFATLMMTIGGSVSVFMSVADIIAPTPYYQSFEDYKNFGSKERKLPNEEDNVILSEEELRKNYEMLVHSYRQNQIERSKNSLIKSFGWIVVPFPIFIYFHRRLNRKE